MLVHFATSYYIVYAKRIDVENIAACRKEHVDGQNRCVKYNPWAGLYCEIMIFKNAIALRNAFGRWGIKTLKIGSFFLLFVCFELKMRCWPIPLEK